MLGRTIPFSLFHSSLILSLLKVTVTRVVLGILLVTVVLFLVMVCFEFPAVIITWKALSSLSNQILSPWSLYCERAETHKEKNYLSPVQNQHILNNYFSGFPYMVSLYSSVWRKLGCCVLSNCLLRWNGKLNVDFYANGKVKCRLASVAD